MVRVGFPLTPFILMPVFAHIEVTQKQIRKYEWLLAPTLYALSIVWQE